MSSGSRIFQSSDGSFNLLVTIAIAGILTHQHFFKRVEVDPHPVLVFIVSILFAVGANNVIATQIPDSPPFILLFGTFFGSIFSSILVYRAFLHPLRNFPDPFAAKLTKMCALIQAARTGLKWYKVDAELHERYGDYVRTGK